MPPEIKGLSFEVVKKRIEDAEADFLREDSDLLKDDVGGGTICHRLAVYIEKNSTEIGMSTANITSKSILSETLRKF